MAVIEHQYEEATHRDIEDCIKWCQNVLNLRDWQILIDTNGSPPVEFHDEEDVGRVLAKTSIHLRRLKAFVWVPVDRLKRKNVSPLQTVIHEMLHIVCGACNLVSDSPEDDNDEDYLIYRLEEPLYRLYCYEKGIKPSPVIEDTWMLEYK